MAEESDFVNAHVVFMDVVRYSTKPIGEQTRVMDRLAAIVGTVLTGATGGAGDPPVKLPTGDGVALVFFDATPLRAVECARGIGAAARGSDGVELRIGVHSGLVRKRLDINANLNVAGNGINLAQRVMDVGDAGHILISKAVADVLLDLDPDWRRYLHRFGIVSVKHGARLEICSLHGPQFGNAALPRKLSALRTVLGHLSLATILSWTMLVLAVGALWVLMRAAWFNLVPWSDTLLVPVAHPAVATAPIGLIVMAFVVQFRRTRSWGRSFALDALVTDRAGRLSGRKVGFAVSAAVAVAAAWSQIPATVGIELVAGDLEDQPERFKVAFVVRDTDYESQRGSYYAVTTYVGPLNPEGRYIVEIGLAPYGVDGSPEFGAVLVEESFRGEIPSGPRYHDARQRAFVQLAGGRADFTGLHEVRVAGTRYRHRRWNDAHLDASVTAGSETHRAEPQAIAAANWTE